VAAVRQRLVDLRTYTDGVYTQEPTIAEAVQEQNAASESIRLKRQYHMHDQKIFDLKIQLQFCKTDLALARMEALLKSRD